MLCIWLALQVSLTLASPRVHVLMRSRCHRIGQKLPETVYKLVSLPPVDENIYKMQVRKSEMSASMGEEVA
jgi:SNF2 family DNA or RNA helicase